MASLAESENRGPSTKGEDSLSTLVDIMKDLDAHYSADDDMVVVQKIRETNSDIKKIIKEKEVEPRKLIRDLANHLEKMKEEAQNIEKASKRSERTDTLEQDIEETTQSIQRLAKEERHTLSSIENLESQIADAHKKGAKLDHQGAVDAPRVKYALSLYGNISNIVWDYTSDNVKGVITSPYGGPVTSFNIDPSSCSSYEITNRLWGMMESSP